MLMMHDALNRLGLKAVMSNGMIFIWIEIPKQYTTAQFATLLLEKAHVIATPRHLFGDMGEGFI